LVRRHHHERKRHHRTHATGGGTTTVPAPIYVPSYAAPPPRPGEFQFER